MGFRKPFRAVPIRLDTHYQRRRRRAALLRMVRYGVIAMAVGVGAGFLLSAADADRLSGNAEIAAAGAGIVGSSQSRRPFAWRRCSDARAAGAAPVLRGQPGYAPWLDADGDGIGCETLLFAEE